MYIFFMDIIPKEITWSDMWLVLGEIFLDLEVRMNPLIDATIYLLWITFLGLAFFNFTHCCYIFG